MGTIDQLPHNGIDGVTGPAGPKGDTGATGATGPQGPSGTLSVPQKADVTNISCPSGQTTNVCTITYTPNNANAFIKIIVTFLFSMVATDIFTDVNIDGTTFFFSTSPTFAGSSTVRKVYTYSAWFSGVSKTSHSFHFSVSPNSTITVVEAHMILEDYS